MRIALLWTKLFSDLHLFPSSSSNTSSSSSAPSSKIEIVFATLLLQAAGQGRRGVESKREDCCCFHHSSLLLLDACECDLAASKSPKNEGSYKVELMTTDTYSLLATTTTTTTGDCVVSAALGVEQSTSSSQQKRPSPPEARTAVTEDKELLKKLDEDDDPPLIKLSVSLLKTYRGIHAKASAKDKKENQSNNEKKKSYHTNHEIVKPGRLLHGRYRIKEIINKGGFGTVVRAKDIKSLAVRKQVAIKIFNRARLADHRVGSDEIEVLTQLQKKDPNDRYHIVRLLTNFTHRRRQCLVFEMLSMDLWDLLRQTNFIGVSLELTRRIGKQVLETLAFLAKKEVGIIHCDLKLQNIVLCHPKKSRVKVIDFGLACPASKTRPSSCIQTIQFRAPEVILDLPYSHAIDTWSLGCILAEMHTGSQLFLCSENNFSLMRRIVQRRGMIPLQMLENASEHIKSKYFEKEEAVDAGGVEWKLQPAMPSSSTNTSTETKELIVPSTDPIASLRKVIAGAAARQTRKIPQLAELNYNSADRSDLFVDLLDKMLALDPGKRITPMEALNHPFIRLGGERRKA